MDVKIAAAQAFGGIVAFKLAIIGAFLILGGSLVRMIGAWDAEIYIRIASNLYHQPDDPYLYVFAPLFPGLIHVFNGFWAAFLIANLFTIGAIYLLYDLTNFRTAILFAAFPTFIVFGTSAYADPIMLFFLIGAYWLYTREKYWLMTSSLTLAALSKYTALFALPVFLGLMLYRGGFKLKNVLAFAIPSVAIGGVMYWLWIATSDPLAFMHLQARWGASGLVDPVTQADWVLRGWYTNQPAVLANTQPWIWLVRNYAFQIPILGLILLAAYRGKGELALIGIPFVLLTFTTIGMPAISTPRLILPGAWVVFVAFKDQIQTHKTDSIILFIMFLIVGLSWLLNHANGAFVA